MVMRRVRLPSWFLLALRMLCAEKENPGGIGESRGR